MIDDLDVCQALAARTYLILALDNVNARALQNTPCFRRAAEVQIKYSFVVFKRSEIVAVVFVVLLEVLMSVVGCTTRSVHVGRVEDNAVNGRMWVGKFSRINPLPYVRGEHLVKVRQNILPENTFSESYIGDSAARRDVKRQD